MFRAFLVALCLASTTAYTPAAMTGSKLAHSSVAGARPTYVMPTMDSRSSEITMSAVTERDANGKPVTHYEMFEVGWVVVALAPWLALLVLNPF